MPELTQAIVQELLTYDPATGVLTWRERGPSWAQDDAKRRAWNTRYAGTRAGTPYTKKNGYVGMTISLLGKQYIPSRIIWLYMTGAWPKGEIDHRNRNGADNSWRNLRDTPHETNMRNLSMRKDNTSGIVGVSWAKHARKWRARVSVKGKTRHLGYFREQVDAELAVLEARSELGFTDDHGATVC